MLGYNNISALRQQLKRVHGIFEGKDWAPNSRFIDKYLLHVYDLSLLVIPDYAKFMLVFFPHLLHKLYVQKCKRQLNELLHALSKSHSACLIQYFHLTLLHRAAGLATGCQVSIEYSWGSVFDLRQNKALGKSHNYFILIQGD